jgi:hypothetical protein
LDKTGYCKDHAIVGYDGKEIPLQQLFEVKSQGHPKEQRREDIEEWLASISEDLKSPSFEKLAKKFKEDYPDYNCVLDRTIAKQLGRIFQEHLKKEFPVWFNTIPENLGLSSKKDLVEHFKENNPKYSTMKTKTIINIVEEHIADI